MSGFEDYIGDIDHDFNEQEIEDLKILFEEKGLKALTLSTADKFNLKYDENVVANVDNDDLFNDLLTVLQGEPGNYFEQIVTVQKKKEEEEGDEEKIDLGGIIPLVKPVEADIALEEIDKSKIIKSFEENQNVFENNISKIIEVPPLKRIKQTVSSGNTDSSIPGDFVMDSSGKLQKQFFVYDGLANNNIKDFNNFISERIFKIISSKAIVLENNSKKNLEMVFSEPILYKPALSPTQELTPWLVSIKGIDYTSELRARVSILDKTDKNNIIDVTDEVLPEDSRLVSIGQIPIMVRSELCTTSGKSDIELIKIAFDTKDPGGYFIMNGLEKVVLIQEKLRVNHINTYYNSKDEELISKMTCSTDSYTSIVKLIFDSKTGVIKYHLKSGNTKNTSESVNVLIPYKILGEKLKDVSMTPQDIWSFIGIYCKPGESEKIYNKLLNSFADLASVDIDEIIKKYISSSSRDESDVAKSRATEKPADRLIKNREEFYKQLNRKMFPQLNGKENQDLHKLKMLSYMLYRFLAVLTGIREPDDRDDWSIKRLSTPGVMMEQLFSYTWNSMIDNLQRKVSDKSKKAVDIVSDINSDESITREYSSSFSGQWGTNRGQNSSNTDITKILERASLAQIAAMITEISTPTDKKTKKPEVRMVQASQLRVVCPVDTPESNRCGLVKHVAVTCLISIKRDPNIIIKELETSKEKLVSTKKTENFDCICTINGIVYKWCNGERTHKYLLLKRRFNKIPIDITINFNSRHRELEIYTTSGRPLSPLLIANKDEEGKLVLEIDRKNIAYDSPYEKLISNGIIEYLDVLEESNENVVVAQSIDQFVSELNNNRQTLRKIQLDLEEIKKTINDLENPDVSLEIKKKIYSKYDFQSIDQPELINKLKEEKENIEEALNNAVTESQYTHCQLDPTSILGISASLIPLSDHNQGPRNTYQSSMGKQALGLVDGSISHKMRDMKVLAYPTRPFFATQASKWLGMDDVPAGQTVMVAFMNYTGYNQEDAILINKKSIQLGSFRYTYYKTVKDTLCTEGVYTKPKPGKGENESLYAALDDTGLPIPNSKVKEGDYLIGKVKEVQQNDGTIRKINMSVKVPKDVEGVVDKVYYSRANGVIQIFVRIRQTRIPIRGDKFACYTPDHQVLTENGWIPINEINTEHKVATLNKETHEIEYHFPDNLFEYDFDGELYHIKNQQIDLTVTQNHKMYVKENDKYELREAKEIMGKRVKYMNIVDSFEVNDPGNNEETEELTKYKGKVYCLEVPNNVLYVRRNGKTVWCGNSRHAQKSTIGLIVNEEDMPRTGSGVTPDIIINSLAIPTRMTLGMILELLASKSAVMSGERINATAFRNFTVEKGSLEKFQRLLKDYGFSPTGQEAMYDGRTGKIFPSTVFIGPVYYQLLKHLAEFKHSVRGGIGEKQAMTRQPVAGRTRNGGLRHGEMERDCVIGHGAARYLKSKLCDQSDAHTFTICSKCNENVHMDITTGELKCKICESDQDLIQATAPFVLKTLKEDLAGAQMKLNFIVGKKLNMYDVTTTIEEGDS